MFAVRCTRKLLDRGAPKPLVAPAPSTTLLGDWYANILFVRPEYLVLCLSEKTLLPVIVSAKDVKRLPQRVTEAAREVMISLGIPAAAVELEVNEMQNGYLAPTANRKVLGCLNDFMFHLEYEYRERPGLTLLERALRLANMPSSALEFLFPSEATRALFTAQIAIASAKGAA
jgi:hypothetical protein